MSKKTKLVLLAVERAKIALVRVGAVISEEAGHLLIKFPGVGKHFVVSLTDEKLETSLRIIQAKFEPCICLALFGETRCNLVTCSQQC